MRAFIVFLGVLVVVVLIIPSLAVALSPGTRGFVIIGIVAMVVLALLGLLYLWRRSTGRAGFWRELERMVAQRGGRLDKVDGLRRASFQAGACHVSLHEVLITRWYSEYADWYLQVDIDLPRMLPRFEVTAGLWARRRRVAPPGALESAITAADIYQIECTGDRVTARLMPKAPGQPPALERLLADLDAMCRTPEASKLPTDS